jgi:hypothetical protein
VAARMNAPPTAGVIVDSNVWLDVFEDDSAWYP